MNVCATQARTRRDTIVTSIAERRNTILKVIRNAQSAGLRLRF